MELYGLKSDKEQPKPKKTTQKKTKSTKSTKINKDFKPLVEIKKEEKEIEEIKPIEIKEPISEEEIKEIMNKKEEFLEEDSENVNGFHSKIGETDIRLKKFIHHESKERPISAQIIKSYLYLSDDEFNTNIKKVLENYPNIKKVEFKGNKDCYIWDGKN